MRLAAVLCAATLAGGCAVGNQHVYRGASAEIGTSGDTTVAVATQDLRPYVASGEKAPNFVGLSGGGFGNPFNVTTASGNALAQDFSATIARSLEAKGYKATAVSVAGSALANVKDLVAKSGKERLALVTINEWKSDTMMNTALYYDLLLRVYDAGGRQLAENWLGGKDDLGGSAMNPPGHAREAVPLAYRRKLEELFDSEALRQSLR